MANCTRSRWYCALSLSLLAVSMSGCHKNVRFLRLYENKLPNVLPINDSNRFGLNFTVINKSDDDAPPNTYKVKVRAWYGTSQQDVCFRETFIPITKLLVAKTGKVVIEDYRFDNPQIDGDPCICRHNYCEGGLNITLLHADTGERAKGINTKFNISWKKGGHIDDVVITAQ
ncbi:MAG: hypothetical protein CMJ18_00285 [Phycisphaeraceae bacterium]|nr:hypothetical protein [Phycisphaeraceae bacterium]